MKVHDIFPKVLIKYPHLFIYHHSSIYLADIWYIQKVSPVPRLLSRVVCPTSPPPSWTLPVGVASQRWFWLWASPSWFLSGGGASPSWGTNKKQMARNHGSSQRQSEFLTIFWVLINDYYMVNITWSPHGAHGAVRSLILWMGSRSRTIRVLQWDDTPDQPF
jgi:hypothetical protein